MRFKKCSGLTLIELIIAIFILTMVFIPVLSISRSISQNLKSVEIRDAGYRLCSGIIEERICQDQSGATLENKSYSIKYYDYQFRVTEQVTIDRDLTQLTLIIEHPQLKTKIQLARLL